MIRIVACVFAHGRGHACHGPKEHWSQLLRADDSKSHLSLDDIHAAYQAQHGSQSRLRGTGLKQLERWSHWQAMRGGQTQRVPASSWWQESAEARAQWPAE